MEQSHPPAKKEIITEMDRKSFAELLKYNPGLIIIKFTASWCGPCKTIASAVDDQFTKTPDNVICASIDVDDNFDIYAFMKTKKQVKGIPAILAYKKGNTTVGPDFSVSGSDTTKIIEFFQNCVKYVNAL